MESKPANTDGLRIVVLGKAGDVTTALINIILVKESTEENGGSECKVIEGVFEKKPVAFIDTPGLLRTDLTDKKLREELMKCILHATPGPHVFLYVRELEAITDVEMTAVKKLEKIFENSKAFFLGVVMSDEVISDRDHDHIQEGFKEYFSGCVTVNTEEPNVSELMKKIKEMAEKQVHYTNELCEKAEKLRNSGETVEAIANNIISSFTDEAFSGWLKKGIEEFAVLLDKTIQRLS